MRVLIIHTPFSKSRECTVTDCLGSFGKYSKHNIEYISTKDFFTKENNLSDYDCLCLYKIHFSHENFLSLNQKFKIKNYNGLKIIFLEEEYFLINERVENIKFMGISFAFSPLPLKVIRKIYKNLFKEVKIVKIFNGYLDDYMFGHQLPPYQNRPIDVSYRALKLQAFYGRLGQEKNNIGAFFLRHTEKYNLSTDISNEYSKRLFGQKWHNLLYSSKAVLGVEGHSGVVDFNRGIYDSSIEFEKKNPNASFEKIERIFFNGLDAIYNTRCITPRHFEYAAFKCLMLLYEGEYEGILEPYRHYVPIKKDFSNIEEVIDILKSPKKAEEIIERAYREIAKNPQYHFKAYVELFDQTLEKNIKNVQRSDEVPLTVRSAKLSKNSSKNTYSLIKEYLDQRLDSQSTLYQFLQYLVRTYKNTLCLWKTSREESKNLLIALKWFILFFLKKDVLIPLFALLTHFKEREQLLKSNIINIQHKMQYCEVESIYPCERNLISVSDYLALMSELKPKYLFFNLSDSWHLNDVFRRNFAIKMASSVYAFLKVMSEQE